MFLLQVTYPQYEQYLEIHGFFVYLYAVANVVLIYALYFAASGTRVAENHRVSRQSEILENFRGKREALCKQIHKFILCLFY